MGKGSPDESNELSRAAGKEQQHMQWLFIFCAGIYHSLFSQCILLK